VSVTRTVHLLWGRGRGPRTQIVLKQLQGKKKNDTRERKRLLLGRRKGGKNREPKGAVDNTTIRPARFGVGGREEKSGLYSPEKFG